MQVILLEKVGKFGNIGSVVTVKDGYARNYLLPRKKAIRATRTNIEYFEKKRAELEADNAAKRLEAESISEKLNGIAIVLIRQAGDDGRLYGSVTGRDIARAITDKTQVEVESECIILSNKVKEIGIYNVDVALHPEVSVTVSLNVARSDNEAKSAHKKNKGEEEEAPKKAPAKAKKPRVKKTAEAN
jgi:large subunit ribosomal protein L9